MQWWENFWWKVKTNKSKGATSMTKEEKEGKHELSSGSTKIKLGVSLPKVVVKKFTGDSTFWQQFWDTFEATVHENEILSEIEESSYLKGFLGGAAERCIDGIPLTKYNYSVATSLLHERYGNKQLIIATHMSKLLKLEKVKNGRSSKEVRDFFDKIEGHVRSLVSMGVHAEHYGPLLIPIVLDRLPDNIKLQISRTLGDANWL